MKSLKYQVSAAYKGNIVEVKVGRAQEMWWMRGEERKKKEEEQQKTYA